LYQTNGLGHWCSLASFLESLQAKSLTCEPP
jgi:hypothetical protein